MKSELTEEGEYKYLEIGPDGAEVIVLLHGLFGALSNFEGITNKRFEKTRPALAKPVQFPPQPPPAVSEPYCTPSAERSALTMPGWLDQGWNADLGTWIPPDTTTGPASAARAAAS